MAGLNPWVSLLTCSFSLEFEMNSQILLAKGRVPIGEIFYRPSYEPAKSFPSINAKTSDTKINLITKHGSKSKMLHTWKKEKQRLWAMGDLPVQDLVEWPHAGPCTWLKEIDAGVSQMKSKKSWFVWQRSLINQCESVNLCPISILNLQLSLRTTNRKYIQGPEVNLFA